MPQIGEIKTGKQLGYKDCWNKFIWVACQECEKPRWVRLNNKGVARSLRCKSCCNIGRHFSEETKKKIGKANTGDKSSRWKGGKYKDNKGYIKLKIYPDNFFYSMANPEGYVSEHRLVVAKALGRNLHSWEIVHHKKGYAKDDNRYPKTLQLVSIDKHNQFTILENRITHLEGKLEEQAKLIKLLQWQIKEREESYRE